MYDGGVITKGFIKWTNIIDSTTQTTNNYRLVYINDQDFAPLELCFNFPFGKQHKYNI